jgi:hypothetical protein
VMPPHYSGQSVPCYRWPKSDNHRHDLGEILISLGFRNRQITKLGARACAMEAHINRP